MRLIPSWLATLSSVKRVPGRNSPRPSASTRIDVASPVAELPAVCRSLRKVGGQLDTLLRLESRGSSSFRL